MWHLFKGRVYWRLTLRVSFFCRGKIIILTVWMVLKTKFFFYNPEIYTMHFSNNYWEGHVFKGGIC